MHRRILIIDDHDDLATALSEVFSAQKHEVTIVERRADLAMLGQLEDFDLVITDLDVPYAEPVSTNNGPLPGLPQPEPDEHLKAFTLSASNYRRDSFDEEELKAFVATVLDYKIR